MTEVFRDEPSVIAASPGGSFSYFANAMAQSMIPAIE